MQRRDQRVDNDDGGSNLLWNVAKFIEDNIALYQNTVILATPCFKQLKILLQLLTFEMKLFSVTFLQWKLLYCLFTSTLQIIHDATYFHIKT
jgi:hypothetical protein